MSENRFLSDKQRNKLAELLNQRFDLPLVKGKSERKAWVKFVVAVESVIASKVQDEYLVGLNDKDFQLEKIFAKALKDNLSPFLASFLIVPILPGFLKRKMIDMLIEVIVHALANATKLDEVIEEFLKENL